MPRRTLKDDGRAIAIYHVVYSHEDFEHAAQVLYQLVLKSEQDFPGRKRMLFLDIEGHRNSAGGFDEDMFELQKDFLGGFLFQFVSEFSCPLFRFTNPHPQNDGLLGELIIEDRRSDKAAPANCRLRADPTLNLLGGHFLPAHADQRQFSFDRALHATEIRCDLGGRGPRDV